MLLRLNKNMRKGTTLIESMWAILIMAIVALAGGAFIFFSSIRVNQERVKRIALEMANARLEELHVAGYAGIDGVCGGSDCSIKKNSGSWVIGNDELLDIRGVAYPIDTNIQYDYISGESGYLFAEARVVYKEYPSGSRQGMNVTLTTFIR